MINGEMNEKESDANGKKETQKIITPHMTVFTNSVKVNLRWDKKIYAGRKISVVGLTKRLKVNNIPLVIDLLLDKAR